MAMTDTELHTKQNEIRHKKLEAEMAKLEAEIAEYQLRKIVADKEKESY